MRRSGDVHHQPVIPFQPDLGAITHGPSPQTFQEPLIFSQIRQAALQMGTKGTRIGKGHATIQTQALRFGIQTVVAVCIVLQQCQDKWPLTGDRQQCLVTRQPRKPS